jgi:hypothetical protein
MNLIIKMLIICYLVLAITTIPIKNYLNCKSLISFNLNESEYIDIKDDVYSNLNNETIGKFYYYISNIVVFVYMILGAF